MKSLSPEAKAALAAYRGEHALPAEVRARARLALGARVASGQAAASTAFEVDPPRLPPTHRVRLLRASMIGGVGTLALLGGLLLGGGKTRPDAAPARTPSAELQPHPAPSAPSSIEHVAPAEPAPTPPSEALATTHARRGKAATQGTRAAALAALAPAPSPAAASPATPADDTLVADPGEAAPERASLTTPAYAAQGTPASGGRALAPAAARQEPSLDAEVGLLRAAHEQLRSGQALRALGTLREHAERFPRGELQEMRKVTRIMALCALGKLDTARHEADQFLSEFKSSSYAARVRQVCDAPQSSSQLP